MDFSELDYNAQSSVSHEMQINNIKTGEPVDSYLSFIGTDSDTFTNAQGDLLREMRAGDVDLNSMTSEQSLKYNIGILTRCCTGVRSISIDGRELTNGREDLEAFFTQFKWVIPQCLDFIRNDELFLMSAQNQLKGLPPTAGG